LQEKETEGEDREGEENEMERVRARQYFRQFYANSEHPENDEQQDGQ